MTLRAILRVVLGLPYPEPLGEREARENALPLGQGIRPYAGTPGMPSPQEEVWRVDGDELPRVPGSARRRPGQRVPLSPRRVLDPPSDRGEPWARAANPVW